jgi:ubiquinone/menaquinone biosynthesis C-methylase UbiE
MSGSTAPGSAYSSKQYWAGVASARSGDGRGFAPVLHPDAPAWFNAQIDRIQFRAIKRALAIAGISPGARILDVGCGTGRWIGRYGALGFQATGVDATAGMIRIARSQNSEASVAVGEAGALPFPSKHFDLVTDVTVIQHVPAANQRPALAEMVRTAKPGGHILLLELIRGQGVHIFPRKAEGWIELAKSCGAGLIDWFGQEYLLLDRAFARTAQMIRGRSHNRLPTADVAFGTQLGLSRRIFWSMRRLTLFLSGVTEPLVERIVPNEIATHAVFVFRKEL